MVSVSERSLPELVSDTGKPESLGQYEKLNSTEKTRHLRPEILEILLSHTTRGKVVRLGKALAESLELPWRDIGGKHNERLGISSRWIAVARDKKILQLKKMNPAYVQTVKLLLDIT